MVVVVVTLGVMVRMIVRVAVVVVVMIVLLVMSVVMLIVVVVMIIFVPVLVVVVAIMMSVLRIPIQAGRADLDPRRAAATLVGGVQPGQGLEMRQRAIQDRLLIRIIRCVLETDQIVGRQLQAQGQGSSVQGQGSGGLAVHVSLVLAHRFVELSRKGRGGQHQGQNRKGSHTSVSVENCYDITMSLERHQAPWTDRLGMLVATACGLHCATLTAVFLSFPGLWLNRRYWEIGLWQKLLWLEWSLLALAWLLMLASLALNGLRASSPWTTLAGMLGLVGMTVLVLSPLHFASPWVGAGILACGILVGLSHFGRLRRI